MVIHRNTFFLLLALLYIIIITTPRLAWVLRSQKTTGIFAFQGKGNALEQLPEQASWIYFTYKNDTFWLKSLGGLGLPENTPVPVRFQKNDPRDARLDSVRAIWYPIIIYGSMPFLVLIVAFLHPQIVPWRSRVIIIPRKPFIKVIP